MFSNMVASLIQHEAIKTTLPKAKELRRVFSRATRDPATDGQRDHEVAGDEDPVDRL